MSLIVAVDGPSDSGKSTLIAGLEQRLGAEAPVLFPCYVDEAGGDNRVPGFSTSVDEQLRAIDFYLQLESRRYRRLAKTGGTAELVLLDRSALTLLAHSYAVEQLHGMEIYDRCREKVTTATEAIIPELVLYLDADVEERRKRADRRDLDKWFTDRRFNEEIRAFFLRRIPACGGAPPLHVLNANQPAPSVLSDAVAIISSNLR